MFARILSAIVLTYWFTILMTTGDYSAGLRLMMVILFASIFVLGWLSGMEFLKSKAKG